MMFGERTRVANEREMLKGLLVHSYSIALMSSWNSTLPICYFLLFSLYSPSMKTSCVLTGMLRESARRWGNGESVGEEVRSGEPIEMKAGESLTPFISRESYR